MTVLAIPAQSLRENLKSWKTLISKEIPIVSSLKGIEVSTQKRMTEVIVDVLEMPENKLAIITGPNLAREVVLRRPTGAVAASTSQELADLTAQTFSAPYFRVYTSNDVIGCELAGAAKNVIALAVGMSIGMGFGENTQALVITRGLNELTRLGMARGALPLTFVGLAGVGDLLATCGSPLSRNRSFGESLGRTGSMDKARAEAQSTVEGVATASAVVDLLEMPENKLAIITGPNLAREVVLRQPTGAVAASTSQELADLTAQTFSAPYFRVYTSNDVIGCELAGAAKNVIALAVGMSIGMGFGENTQALVITRGLNELTRLGMARGALPLTFVGLAGVGDLLATCGSPLSRNRSFGESLGRTGSMDKARAEAQSTVEGVATASAVVDLAHLVGVEAPIMEAVKDVVSNTISPQQAIVGLMKIHTGVEIDYA